MLLLLKEAIKRRGDDLQLFQEAYYWRFQKHIDIGGDIIAWRVQERVPQYVIEYLRHIYEI
jgi:hypothetical protein